MRKLYYTLVALLGAAASLANAENLTPIHVFVTTGDKSKLLSQETINFQWIPQGG